MTPKDAIESIMFVARKYQELSDKNPGNKTGEHVAQVWAETLDALQSLIPKFEVIEVFREKGGRRWPTDTWRVWMTLGPMSHPIYGPEHKFRCEAQKHHLEQVYGVGVKEAL